MGGGYLTCVKWFLKLKDQRKLEDLCKEQEKIISKLEDLFSKTRISIDNSKEPERTGPNHPRVIRSRTQRKSRPGIKDENKKVTFKPKTRPYFKLVHAKWVITRTLWVINNLMANKSLVMMRVFRMEGRNGPDDNYDQKSTSLWWTNVSSISTR